MKPLPLCALVLFAASCAPAPPAPQATTSGPGSPTGVAGAHPGERVQLRAAHVEVRAEGVSESAGPDPERGRGCPGAGRGPSGVLRLLRLALLGARALDAGAVDPDVSGAARDARRSSRRSTRISAREHIQVEAAYFKRPGTQAFERTYGWAWVLKFAEELHRATSPEAKRWQQNLQPLTDALVQRYLDFLPKQTYAIRTGLHPNTAFGLAFALDYANAIGHTALKDLLIARSLDYFGKDVDYPAKLEPNGSDFLSPALAEADLMRRVLAPAEFATWFRAYLPRMDRGEPKNLLEIAVVTDRSDPQLGHLDGLNLSRAWCMRHIAAALPAGDPSRAHLAAAGYTHAVDALKNVATGHYEGEHWLASFAVYLLTEGR